MNKILAFIILFYIWDKSSAQKDTLYIEEKLSIDTVVEPYVLPILEINDYDLRGHFKNENLKVVINDLGAYQYKDSTLVNAKIKLWLHTDFTNCTGPNTFGYWTGNIIDGKKNGEWIKKIRETKSKQYVTVKISNYTYGILDGKYQVFDLNGNTLYFNTPHPLFSEEHKNYEVFKNGTGWYFDYFYETGVLMELGFYKQNKKHGAWIIYDKKGDEMKTEFYDNGTLINN